MFPTALSLCAAPAAGQASLAWQASVGGDPVDGHADAACGSVNDGHDTSVALWDGGAVIFVCASVATAPNASAVTTATPRSHDATPRRTL